MDNRWQTMHAGKFDFGFAVDWMRKDLAICLEEARRNGAKLPVTALVDQYYAEVQEHRRRPLGYLEPHRPLEDAQVGQRLRVEAPALENRPAKPATIAGA